MSRTKQTLYQSYTGGPLGIGDPDSTYISDGERSLIMTKFIQEKFLTDICYDAWKQWRQCIKQNKDKWFPHRSCYDFLNNANECQNSSLYDPEKIKKFEEEYLSIRSKYRKTGIGRVYMDPEKTRKFFNEN